MPRTTRLPRISLCLLLSGRAMGAEIAPAGDENAPPEPAAFRPRVDTPVGPGAGLDAYGGIQALFAGENKSRALVGGSLRGRYHYFQLGAALEYSDTGTATGLFERPEESFTSYSGFLGVVIPFERWIDADASVGLGVRRYENPSPRYGADGFAYETPTLTWRLGVSDRTGEKLLGARIGGGLFGAIDLEPADVRWEGTVLDREGRAQTVTGKTPVGGVSVGLTFSVGLEVGAAAPRSQKRP